mmetsp:Transcript_12299/g.45560  ORF Transcript_12299/g.45560 Transcript_12299/m.45560 type:complete len:242 (-) Transcript_12299:592-1317(-)
MRVVHGNLCSLGVALALLLPLVDQPEVTVAQTLPWALREIRRDSRPLLAELLPELDTLGRLPVVGLRPVQQDAVLDRRVARPTGLVRVPRPLLVGSTLAADGAGHARRLEVLLLGRLAHAHGRADVEGRLHAVGHGEGHVLEGTAGLGHFRRDGQHGVQVRPAARHGGLGRDLEHPLHGLCLVDGRSQCTDGCAALVRAAVVRLHAVLRKRVVREALRRDAVVSLLDVEDGGHVHHATPLG